MKYIVYSELDAAGQRALTQRPAKRQQDRVSRQVAAVEQEILQGGDAALQACSLRFDGVALEQFSVGHEFWQQAWQQLEQPFQQALRTAMGNISRFHNSELPLRYEQPLETSPGVHCWREFRAIESVGLYIPGGSAPLFSSMLMLGIPAIIAGCPEIAFCSPPLSVEHGTPWAPESGIYAAVEMLGCMALLQDFAAEIAVQNATPPARLHYFQVGGAQAIFALAYGLEARCSLPAVSKIFGPGNPYVTEAKLQVSQRVAIDMPAGPSEVLVLAESGQNAAIIAADLLAQAEHGPDSQVLLAAPSAELLYAVADEVQRQSTRLPRSNAIAQTLEHSYLIEVKDLEQGLHFSNAYAPEHLILAVEDFAAMLPRISNAGSVFCGAHASESFGDYASGTNHTLPTSGFARSHSGVNTQDFGRWITFQSVSAQGLQSLGATVELLAEKEQLFAHKNAVTLRLQQEDDASQP